MNKLEGKLVADGAKIGIVAARFNEFIVSKLVGGAMDGLIRHDVKEEDVTVAWVPGAFEIPVVAKKMAKSGKYDAVICLGAVIRGATSHYHWRQRFRYCSVSLQPRTSSRQSSVQVQRLETRDTIVPFQLLR